MAPGGTVAGSELARLRQGATRLLAAGYLPPTAARRADLVSGLAALQDLGIRSLAVGDPLARWLHALEAADPSIVTAEHVRLLGAGTDGAVCPPMTSQYLGGNLHGDPARFGADVEELMRRSGFTRRHDSLPPDHLVVQLELMSALCGAEAANREEGKPVAQHLEWQRELTESLGSWLGAFAREIADRDRSGVYRLLAVATAAYVDHDHDLIRLVTQSSGDGA